MRSYLPWKWSFVRELLCQDDLLKVVFHQCGHFIRLTFCQGDLPSGSSVGMTFHHVFFFCAATFHQGGLCQDDLLLKRSFTETVFHQDGVLSDRSFIMVSLSSGWSLSVWFLIAWSLVWGGVSFIKTALDRTACHQSSLSSWWSFASCMTKVYFWFSLN